MKNNKFLSALTFILLASFIVAGCGTQVPAEPEDASVPQTAESEPASASEAPTVTETDAPTEEATPTEAPTEAPTETPTEAPTEEALVSTVSFAADVLPIIESRCVNCHGGREIEEGLLMRTYDEIMTGSDNGAVIIPGDVEGSLLVELITSQEMPKRGPKLTPVQVKMITDWVAAGAPNN